MKCNITLNASGKLDANNLSMITYIEAKSFRLFRRKKIVNLGYLSSVPGIFITIPSSVFDEVTYGPGVRDEYARYMTKINEFLTKGDVAGAMMAHQTYLYGEW